MSDDINKLLLTYQQVLNQANLDLLKRVYTDDAVVIGQPFPTTTGIEAIEALYADFLSKLDFDIRFELLEFEHSGDLGYVRTRSHGTTVPKGQPPSGSAASREVFIVKKTQGAWKVHRYLFNADVAG